MEIIRGKIPGAKKIVVYGPEGIGKSTFASRFPAPLFIDTEGSTKEMDVARLPEPSSWTMLLEQIGYVQTHPEICKTLVIDTIDWAEQMCIEYICDKHQKEGLESFGYGTGYTYEREEFGRFLNRLSGLINAGINVVLTAHAALRKFEQPDEMGAYDRWELKLGKKTTSQISPLVKEWADMVLFVNYKIYSVAVDDKGKKHKAQGGRRVMYTTHHSCWDAKNRYGLPDEMEFDYAGIAHIFAPAPTKSTETAKASMNLPVKEDAGQNMADAGRSQPNTSPSPAPAQKESAKSVLSDPETKAEAMAPPDIPVDERIPKELRDLMLEYSVGEWDIQNVVAARGYYPSDTPIANYDPGFVKGSLVGAWPKVFGMIKEMRDTMEIPFN